MRVSLDSIVYCLQRNGSNQMKNVNYISCISYLYCVFVCVFPFPIHHIWPLMGENHSRFIFISVIRLRRPPVCANAHDCAVSGDRKRKLQFTDIVCVAVLFDSTISAFLASWAKTSGWRREAANGNYS